MNRLRVWTGPVRSEKTTKAAKMAGRLARHFRVALIRPIRAVRPHESDPNVLIAQGGERWPCHNVASALEIEPTAVSLRAGVVWVDEPHLFDDEPHLFAQIQAIRLWAPVLVSGISSTDRLEPLGPSMPRILAVADEIVVCRADCEKCCEIEAATRSFDRTGTKTEAVRVGGAESYWPLCQTCWCELTYERNPQ
jgi:thymidine kinase